MALICVAPVPALAQDSVAIGGSVGVYVPTDSATRDALGSSWFSWGIGPVQISSANGRRVSSDLGFLIRKNGGNKLFMLRPTMGFSQSFGDPTKTSAVPYVALRTGPAYADYSITRFGVYSSDKKIGWNGNVELGVVFNQVFAISARYDVMSKFNDYNFNGWTLSARFQIARF